MTAQDSSNQADADANLLNGNVAYRRQIRHAAGRQRLLHPARRYVIPAVGYRGFASHDDSPMPEKVGANDYSPL